MTNAFGALEDAFNYTYIFSMSLLAFNLLPIPPLDGFHVLEELLPYKFKASDGYRKFQSADDSYGSFPCKFIWQYSYTGYFAPNHKNTF